MTPGPADVDDEPPDDGATLADANGPDEADTTDTIDVLDVLDALPGPSKSKVRRAIEITISFAIVVAMFGLVIPWVADTSWPDIWEQIEHLTAAEILLLTGVWILSLVIYTFVFVASLPGLRHTQAFVVNTAGSALSNTVPLGGALGIGVTYAMLTGWGFTVDAITLSILVTGCWNVFVKLGLPVAALVLLTFTGHATGGLFVASIVGLAALSGAIVLFMLVLKTDRMARLVGSWGDRLGSKLTRLARRPPVEGLADAAVKFRHQSVGLVSVHWPQLTFWMVAYNLGQFVILLLSLHVIGQGELGWIDIFAAFSFGRLLSVIPLSPSGVGFVETGLTASLIAFGGDAAPVAAGVLLFSTLTYALEIPLGLVGWLAWTGEKNMTSEPWRRGPKPVPENLQAAIARAEAKSSSLD